MAIFLDAHVHVYPQVPIEELLCAALENFNRAANGEGVTEPRDYALCFTESAGMDVFSCLQKHAESPDKSSPPFPLSKGGTWTFQTTPSPQCLKAADNTNQVIYIFAGRQLISSENLELLSLFADVSIQDKTYSLEELAQKVWASGGTPVLPWGVGKWLGKRKNIVERFIKRKREFPVLLADNGNRPGFWPRPKELRTASESLIPIASGSDPLTLPNHHLRAGSYGGWINQRRLDADNPLNDLKSILVQPGLVVPFGPQATMFSFFHDQLFVNLRKRLPNLFP